MTDTRLYSRRIVLADRVVAGEITVHAGVIESVEARDAASPDALDVGDDLLIPGLVDIHTDNLEKHYQPRPGATWDTVGAVMAHDAQCAAAAITTVLDSLCMHGERNGLDRAAALPVLVEAIDTAQGEGLLRSEHLLHLRCEVTNPALMERIAPHLDHPGLRLLSLMDHRPGQRQMARKAAPEGDPEADAALAALCASHRQQLAQIARDRGINLAAHDDATLDQVEEASALGCSMAEFPVSEEAASAARARGMTIAMGGPNLVRGGSHSGNLSAGDAARAGLLDIVTSDYIPLSMLRGAFMLADADFGWDIPRAIATVTSNPAEATGLTDRGRIAAGLRADLARVRWQPGTWPKPAAVWRAGERVA